MDVCRGGIIDSPPALKASLSPSSRRFPVPVPVPVCLPSLLLGTLSPFTQSAHRHRQSGLRRRRVHPRAAFTYSNAPSNWIGTPDLSARVVLYQRTLLVLQQAYIASWVPVFHQPIPLILSLSRHIPLLLHKLRSNDDNDQVLLLLHWLGVGSRLCCNRASLRTHRLLQPEPLAPHIKAITIPHTCIRLSRLECSIGDCTVRSSHLLCPHTHR
jgi:hypothetical protein